MSVVVAILAGIGAAVCCGIGAVFLGIWVEERSPNSDINGLGALVAVGAVAAFAAVVSFAAVVTVMLR